MTKSFQSEPFEPDPGLTDEDASLFGLDGASGRWMSHLRAATTPGPLGSIGRYELVAEVSRGGQGVVYRARQPGTHRDVALKRLIAGSLATADTQRRFEREVEAVSSLHHPGVVTVYGLELVDGVPVLAMEWVDGVPIDQWANGENGVRRDRDAVLRMFLAICDAVQHAHQNGIVHRDLKPSNILVDAAGQPRVLDFGLAKAIGDRRVDSFATRTGGFLGTPAYAAPEQHDGGSTRIDTRADVYALGVILFEMLTGERPHHPEDGIREYLEAVDREQLPRPSSLRHDLDGEVDAITLKALARSPRDRFQSVGEFADDVRRYLAREPVLAHPPSTWYEVVKLVRRNRAVVALSAVLVVSILGFGVITLRQSMLIADERDSEAEARRAAEDAGSKARQEADKAAALLSFLVGDVLAAASPNESGDRAAIGDVLDAAAARVHERFGDRPLVEGQVRLTIGKVYYNLGRFADAERQLTDCLARIDDIDVATSQDFAVAEYARGLARRSLADEEGALADLQSAMARFEALDPPQHDMVSKCRRAIAQVHEQLDQQVEAERQHQLGLALAGEQLPDDPKERALHLRGIGLARARRGAWAEARVLYDQFLRTAPEVFGANSERVGEAHALLADLDQAEGRMAESIRHSRASLHIYERLFREDHVKVAAALGDLGEMLVEPDQLEEGERLLCRAVEINRKARGPASLFTRIHEARLGKILALAGKLDEAEPLLADALALFVAERNASFIWTHRTRIELARLYEKKRDPENAAAHYAALVEYGRNTERAFVWSPALFGYIRCRYAAGEVDEALSLIDEWLDLVTRRENRSPEKMADALDGLLRWLRARGEDEEAARREAEARSRGVPALAPK